MKYLLLLTTLMLIFISCSKTKMNDDLQGRWVSSDNEHDTIYFYKSDMDLLDVKRPFTTTGYRMPTSGLYTYKFKTDSISVQYLLSSAYYGGRYYFFKKDGDNLTIGNFFAAERSIMRINFRKISN